MHLAVDHGNVGESLEELEELRRMNYGVGNGRFLNECFLSDLGAKLAALSELLRSNHRQRHVMPHARVRFMTKQVTR